MHAQSRLEFFWPYPQLFLPYPHLPQKNKSFFPVLTPSKKPLFWPTGLIKKLFQHNNAPAKKKSGEETLLWHAVSRLWHPFNSSKVAGLHLIDTRICVLQRYVTAWIFSSRFLTSLLTVSCAATSFRVGVCATVACLTPFFFKYTHVEMGLAGGFPM